MNLQKDIDWFKREIEPKLLGYDVTYRYYEQDDFGSLSQVVFEGKEIGGQIDYWSLGWLGVFVWDNAKEVELVNILLSPDEIGKGDDWVDKLARLLTTS